MSKKDPIIKLLYVTPEKVEDVSSTESETALLLLIDCDCHMFV